MNRREREGGNIEKISQTNHNHFALLFHVVFMMIKQPRSSIWMPHGCSFFRAACCVISDSLLYSIISRFHSILYYRIELKIICTICAGWRAKNKIEWGSRQTMMMRELMRVKRGSFITVSNEPHSRTFTRRQRLFCLLPKHFEQNCTLLWSWYDDRVEEFRELWTL